jgi:hypothetical protein
LLSFNINDPITISLFIPTDPTRKAITTMVSLRTDRWGERRQISLVAYHEKDVMLATLTAVDANGLLLSITHQGIHKVSFFGTPAVRKVVACAFDHAGAYGDDQCGVTARLSKLTSGSG